MYSGYDKDFDHHGCPRCDLIIEVSTVDMEALLPPSPIDRTMVRGIAPCPVCHQPYLVDVRRDKKLRKIWFRVRDQYFNEDIRGLPILRTRRMKRASELIAEKKEAL